MSFGKTIKYLSVSHKTNKHIHIFFSFNLIIYSLPQQHNKDVQPAIYKFVFSCILKHLCVIPEVLLVMYPYMECGMKLHYNTSIPLCYNRLEIQNTFCNKLQSLKRRTKIEFISTGTVIYLVCYTGWSLLFLGQSLSLLLDFFNTSHHVESYLWNMVEVTWKQNKLIHVEKNGNFQQIL